MHKVWGMHSLAAIGLMLVGNVSAMAVEPLYDIDDAVGLSRTTGKPILAIAGTTG
jgi:hypothetical protein